MAMVAVESYNFSTVENPLSDGGNFTKIVDTNFTGALRAIAGNLCEPVAIATSSAYFWSGVVPAPGGSWPADQAAEVTLSTWNQANSFAYFFVRQGTATSGTQYVANIQFNTGGATGVSQLFAFVGGVTHTLMTTTGLTTAQGDVWRLQVVGNVLTMFRNGTQAYTFTDTNNFVTAGSPGFGLNSPVAITNVQTGLVTFYANQAATPTFSPVAGTYTGTQTVTITSSTSGGTIYYTTDGTTPTHSSSSISNGGTISVASSLTVKALASVSNFVDSAIASAAYTITGGGGGGGNSGFGLLRLLGVN